MDIEARNRYCGLLMFPVKGPGSKGNDFIMNHYDVNSFSDQPEPYYKSQSDSQETSIAAGAAAAGGEENGKSSGCQKGQQTEKRPPRPPNAFILYRREKQPAILATNRHLTNAQISRYIADLWKSESNETRLVWERLADQTKLEHMKAYPNYVYRPNKNKGKKRPGRKQPAASNDTSKSPVMNPQEDSVGPVRPSTRGQNRLTMVPRRIDLESQTTATEFQSMVPAVTTTPPLEPANEIPLLNLDFTDVPTTELLTPITPQQQQHFEIGWKVVPTQPEPETINHRENILFQPFTFHEPTIDPSILFLNEHDTTTSIYDNPSAYSQNTIDASSLKTTSDSSSSAGFSEFRDSSVNNPAIADIFAFGYFGGSANHFSNSNY
ncbi:16276_t:CDS:1 [Acaulospora colombiana]|uniref:16276_t:CDS:1 n=1 Tax=Acaulospora colombiana TaxID=27376 RepID=A0ACA9KCP8_9GLOM|nr:16276_t:CDS:1 [Acaulospora colombiana]